MGIIPVTPGELVTTFLVFGFHEHASLHLYFSACGFNSRARGSGVVPGDHEHTLAKPEETCYRICVDSSIYRRFGVGSFWKEWHYWHGCSSQAPSSAVQSAVWYWVGRSASRLRLQNISTCWHVLESPKLRTLSRTGPVSHNVTQWIGVHPSMIMFYCQSYLANTWLCSTRIIGIDHLVFYRRQLNSRFYMNQVVTLL